MQKETRFPTKKFSAACNSMTHKLVYTRTSFKDVQKLDSVARKRLRKKIEEYCRNPLFHAKKLVNSSIGTYRWRAGNYRIVFDIDKKI